MKMVDIDYIVPKEKDYNDPVYKVTRNGFKAGDLKPFTRYFKKWNPKEGTMDRLENGFIIFTENAFKGLI